jgi:hypothetical protein
VCPVDEATKVIRGTIESSGRKEVHAVVSPTEATGKICYGHNLQQGDSDGGEFAELLGGSIPAPSAVNVPICIS